MGIIRLRTITLESILYKRVEILPFFLSVCVTTGLTKSVQGVRVSLTPSFDTSTEITHYNHQTYIASKESHRCVIKRCLEFTIR